MNKYKAIITSSLKVLANEDFNSTGDLLDSSKFISDCKHGLEARLDCNVKLDKVDTENDFVRFIGITNEGPELYLSTHDFKGLIELEKYLINKYWNGSNKHLSIIVLPQNKKSIWIEISMSIE